jgi:L-alanine-DL-glutamate epimerase-like enolase superfamily enzyme
MWWMLGAVCNAVISVAYFMIVCAIAGPLVRSRQLHTNGMAAATAAIFLTCAVHHGAHVVHMLMPYAGVDLVQGHAMRAAWGPELALWDLVGAVVGVYYWTLRGGFGAGSDSPALFQDQYEREQRALELNDAVLQGMVVARMALDLGERRKGLSALDGSIEAASRMITELIADDGRRVHRPLRSTAALVEHLDRKPEPDLPPTTPEDPESRTDPAPS